MPRDQEEPGDEASDSRRGVDAQRGSRVRFIGESYRLLFERNPLPMWVYDAKSLYFLAVNDAAVEAYGYSKNEFLRMTIKDIRPREDLPALLQDLARMDSGTESISIWRLLRRDGAIRDVEARGNEMDFDGHRARLILAHDITERVRAERRLRTEYAVTRVLMESSRFQDAVPRLLRAVCEEADWEYGEMWRVSQDGDGLRWEGAWHAEGFDPQPLEDASRSVTVVRGSGIPGTTWATGRPEWLEDLTPQAHFNRAAAAKGLGLRQGISFPISRRSGQVLGVMVFFTRRARDPDPAFLDLMEDLGERMGQFLENEASERDRGRAQERFTKAFHENPAAAAITRLRDGTVLDANANFLTAFEYTREEVIGRSSRDLAIWSEPGQRERILAPIALGGSVHGVEETFRTRSGRTWTALVFVETMSLQDDPTILTTLVDVTNLREAQERLLESERLASIGRTASFVAHELNTPLTNISLLTASIRRQTQEEATRDRLDRIDVQRRLASRIIEEILTFTRSTNLQRRETDLVALVREAADQADAYRKSGVALDLDLGERAVPLAIDPLKMSRAFVNLIKNAYQATDAGRVSVSLRARAEDVAVAVRDTGPGIPPAELERLFVPFHTTKPRGEGVGLGLTFVKAVVEGHGGRVEVASEPGHGATFTVLLPTAPPAA